MKKILLMVILGLGLQVNALSLGVGLTNQSNPVFTISDNLIETKPFVLELTTLSNFKDVVLLQTDLVTKINSDFGLITGLNLNLNYKPGLGFKIGAELFDKFELSYNRINEGFSSDDASKEVINIIFKINF